MKFVQLQKIKTNENAKEEKKKKSDSSWVFIYYFMVVCFLGPYSINRSDFFLYDSCCCSRQNLFLLCRHPICKYCHKTECVVPATCIGHVLEHVYVHICILVCIAYTHNSVENMAIAYTHNINHHQIYLLIATRRTYARTHNNSLKRKKNILEKKFKRRK